MGRPVKNRAKVNVYIDQKNLEKLDSIVVLAESEHGIKLSRSDMLNRILETLFSQS